jgi:hypothetical protein
MATPSPTPPPLAGWDMPDDNHGPRLIAATAVLTGFALVSVILRMWVRIGIIKSVGWDDRVMVLAMVSRLSLSGSHDLVAAQLVY